MIFTVITDQHSAAISVQAVDDEEYSLLRNQPVLDTAYAHKQQTQLKRMMVIHYNTEGPGSIPGGTTCSGLI